VLPAEFPNLLANGTEGIAVGMATSIPPHNLDELCEACQQLIRKKSTSVEELMQIIPAPDFPTAGIIIEPKENILKAYETGKGSIRLRAKWETEEFTRGMYQIVVTEIPYQVQKSRLIEKLADLMKAKKLPLLGNLRDESAENIRIVLEPKNRQVKPEVLMESIFKLSEMETRVSLNLNVISSKGVPQVMSIKTILQEFIEYRNQVVTRRTNNRLAQIAKRLEILDGLLVAYLNIDEVIRIIREEDEPKQVMIKRWDLTDNQAEAILNIRLRNLRKLEEIEIKREKTELEAEQAELQELIDNEGKRFKLISKELGEIRKKFGKGTELGARRSQIADAPTAEIIDIEAFIEQEPITIICSDKGWIRALKGHSANTDDIKYKDGDTGRFIFKAKTTDKILVFGTNGRFYTLLGSNIPTGKGFGEPVKLLLDMPADVEIASILVNEPDTKLLVVCSNAKGFIVNAADCIASTKGGKQILNIPASEQAIKAFKIDGDHVAIIGQNRKLLVFALGEVSEVKKGAGVLLQKYKDGKISDIKTFNIADGLSWQMGGKEGRTRTEIDLTQWLGKRAGAGKLAPNGFPRDNRF